MAAKLILTRKAEMINRRNQYKIIIDGNVAGLIKNDTSEEFALQPGTHTVQCKINWMSSEEHTFTVAEGTKSFLRVKSGMRFIVPLYFMLLAGVLFPLFFSFSKQPLPESGGVIKLVLVLPGIVYFLLYLTLLRKKYLVIEEDKSNPFK